MCDAAEPDSVTELLAVAEQQPAITASPRLACYHERILGVGVHCIALCALRANGKCTGCCCQCCRRLPAPSATTSPTSAGPHAVAAAASAATHFSCWFSIFILLLAENQLLKCVAAEPALAKLEMTWTWVLHLLHLACHHGSCVQESPAEESAAQYMQQQLLACRSHRLRPAT